MHARQPSDTTARAFRQESERIDRRWVFIVGGFLLPFLVVLAAAAAGMFALASRKGAAAQGVFERPDPAAEVSNVSSELFRRPAAGELLKQRQQKQLQRYGWVDRPRGVVRVPIDVAMDLVAKEQP